MKLGRDGLEMGSNNHCRLYCAGSGGFLVIDRCHYVAFFLGHPVRRLHSRLFLLSVLFFLGWPFSLAFYVFICFIVTILARSL